MPFSSAPVVLRCAAVPMLLLAVVVVLAGCDRPAEAPVRTAAPVDSVTAHYLEQASNALQHEDFRTAMALTQAAEQQQPGLPEVRFVRGKVYYALGFYEQAREEWEQVLAEEPDYWLWWQSVGDAAFQQADFAAALQHYRRAAELDPNPVAWHGMASAYWETGRQDSVALALQQALVLDSTYAPAHISMADLRAEEGAIDDALAHARTALRLVPGDAEYRLRVAELLLQSGRPADALPHFEAAQAAEPWNPSPVHGLGSALMQLGREADGSAHLARADSLRERQSVIDVRRQAVRTNPRNPMNHAALAEAYLSAERVRDALAAYKALQVLAPGDLHLQHTIATLHMRLGDKAEAVSRYVAVLRQDSTFVEAWLNLGLLYAREGQQAAADEIWNRVIEQYPSHPGVKTLRERLGR